MSTNMTYVPGPRLNVDEVRERLEHAVKARGKSAGIHSRQVLALMEVLVDMINETEPERE